MTGMTAVPGVSGMTPVQGVPGMTAVPGMATMQAIPGGFARNPNGMSGLYQAEKAGGLLPATVSYQPLGQPAGILAQSSALAGQPAGAGAFYGASQPTYIPVSSPGSQQRYMVSPSFGMPGAPSGSSLVSSPTFIHGKEHNDAIAYISVLFVPCFYDMFMLKALELEQAFIFVCNRWFSKKK